MGMGYSIIADKETNCNGNFPDKLSNFFEQIGGYEEKSEVAQVSKILQIDLSAFHLCDHGITNLKKEKKYWQEIDIFISILEEFINKISRNPNYYKEIRHTKNRDSLRDQMKNMKFITDETSLLKKLEEMYRDPDMLFPPDTEYLSKNKITKDLMDLKDLLECYKKAGATKIKLLYG